jgi:hypothetical protein
MIRIPQLVGFLDSASLHLRPTADNPMKHSFVMVGWCCAALCLACAGSVECKELARGGVYSVIELSFEGPQLGPTDIPARDIEFSVLFRHESGGPEFEVHGFWDGDGKGGPRGDVFRVRFCPTKEGRWILANVGANDDKLVEQHEGDFVSATASDPTTHSILHLAEPCCFTSRRTKHVHAKRTISVSVNV